MKYFTVYFQKFVILCFLLIIISVMVVVQDLKFLKSMRSKPGFIIRTDEVDDLPNWDYRTLIDFEEFEFLTFHNVCNESVLVLVLVHSAPKNYEYRDAIRNTWGKTIPGMKVLFMLGAVQNNSLQIDINHEDGEHQDIIQGNFIDAYKNNTYKHVMCLKYSIYFCSTVRYVLKTDDDVYVNMVSVLDFLRNLDDLDVNEIILCSTRSETPVYRSDSKWAVTFQEYPHSKYPTYCLGPAIIYSHKAVYRLYNFAQRTAYFWIDDVHITGTIAELVGIKRTDLTIVFLDELLLNKLIDGREEPILFFFCIELTEQAIYTLHKAFQNRRNLH